MKLAPFGEKWDGRELWKYSPGDIVRDVDTKYFYADKDMESFIKKYKNGRSWKRRIKALRALYDPQRPDLLYYCLACRRIEDGAHRFFMAGEDGIPSLNVRIGAGCYKSIRPIKWDHQIHEVISELVEDKKDRAWLSACYLDKWPRFSWLDFRGRSFLDVGSQSGFSCLAAWSRGARYSVGVEIRPELVAVAKRARRDLGVPDEKVDFLSADWVNVQFPEKFDIVSCMGLLHYWSASAYPGILASLAEACREFLILELRSTGREAVELKTVGKQTVASAGWLLEALAVNGFKPIARDIREPGRREIWISRRA
jgi:hypothetical protein